MSSVVLATCRALPDSDEDGPLLLAALRDHGVQARWQVWDDPEASWNELTVLRSTWDYAPRRSKFLAWAASVPALENPLPLLEWNSDKVYLAELAAAGIATVPTVFVSPGATVDLPPVDEWVVKPTVGAGSRGAGRFADAAAATAHITTLHEAGRVAMIQPYLAEVDAAGETALIYLDGGYSHAIEKGPMLPPDSAHAPEDEELFVAERISTRSPSAAERAVGDRVLALLAARFGAAPLYARVDLLPSPDGPVVVEVEVTEPSLFLTHDPAAADRFAAAIAARASVRR